MNYFKTTTTKTTLSCLVAVLLAVVLVATACSSDDDAEPAELKLGVLTTFVEPFVAYASPSLNAMEMARDEINAAGGNVVLVAKEHGREVSVASEASDSLLAEGVSAILGISSSDLSLGVIDQITEAETILISSHNSAPIFTHYVDGDLYFRTLPSDALQAIEMANLMIEAGVTNAGILYVDEAYGLGFSRALEDRLIEADIRVGLKVPYATIEGLDDLDRPDLDADVQLLLDARVDGVAIIAFNNTATILGHKLEVGLDPGRVPFFISSASAGGQWSDTNPDNPGALDGTKVIFTADQPEHGEETFYSRYEAYVGEEAEIFSAYSYDAVVILALASLVADSTVPADIAAEINDVTRGGTKCNLYADCAELIRDGEDIDYDGASGVLDFIDAGEPSYGGFDVFEFNEEGSLDFLTHEVVHVDEL